MELYIAGGCREHGRNSFLITGKQYSVLVDCGIMEGAPCPYPYLTREQIAGIRYLFLTHSHKDHAGAVGWLVDNGFRGVIAAAKETRQQTNISYGQWQILTPKGGSPNDTLKAQGAAHRNNQIRLEDSLHAVYGRSGHCVGSLWFLLQFEGKNLLFSGDYWEESGIYACDRLRNIYADAAVLDCGNGNTECSANNAKAALAASVLHRMKSGSPVLLPVPKYGRGLELICLLKDAEEAAPIYGDQGLLRQMETGCEGWFRRKLPPIFPMDGWDGGPAVILVSDAQLSSQTSRELAGRVLESKGQIVLTGHVYGGTYSEALVKHNWAEALPYPVHMGYSQMVKVQARNYFNKVILNHSAGRIADEKEVAVDAGVQDTISV